MPKKPSSREPEVVSRELPTTLRQLTDDVKATLEEETQLLAAASYIELLKPWQILEEHEVFVVVNPETGEPGFVSTLGGLDEVQGVVVYTGIEAYFQLLEFLENAPDDEDLEEDEDEMADYAMDLLQIPRLQFTLDEKEQLEPTDEALLKRHKIALKTDGVLPVFRSTRPGFLPWRLDGGETRFLTQVLEQLAQLLGRPKFSTDVLDLDPDGDEAFAPRFLTRVGKVGKDGTLTWKDGELELQPPAPYAIPIPDLADEFKAIKKKPVDNAIWEVDMNASPAPVIPDDERPFFPEIILMGSKGQVGEPQLTSQSFWAGALPEMLELITHSLVALPKRPRELRFMDPRLQAVLGHIGLETGIKIKMQDELPTLEPAFLSLMEMMVSELPPEFLEGLEGLEGFSDGKLH